MKNILTAALLLFAFHGALAQTVQLENLHTFDKLVVKGNVNSIETTNGHEDRPQVTIEGVSKEQVTNRIEAGVLYLTVSGDKAFDLSVANRNLSRIETDKNVEIVGADVVGDNGRYLITGINRHGDHVAHHIDINIPKIDIDLPGLAIELPEIDFDFDHNFDHNFDIDIDFDRDAWDFDWDWEDHKEEMKNMSKEVKEEVKRAMEEVKHELKKYKKKH